MRLPILRLAFLLQLAVGLAGCSRSAQSRISRHDNAFRNAPPELKMQWEAALSAAKSKDYSVALGTLFKMAVLTNLAPEQAQAVRDVSTVVTDEVYDVANQGDPKAKQAIDDLRKIRGR